MSVEEISHGSEPRPPRQHQAMSVRTRRVLGLLMVVVVLVAAGLALRAESQRRAAAAAAAAAAHAPKPRPTHSDIAGSVVTVGTMCPPVTDHRTSLDISFTLVPDSPLVVQKLLPQLPMGGLRYEGYEVRTGGCGEPGIAIGETPFAASLPVLVTFHFQLPATCPAPLPVGVSVGVKQGNDPAVTRETLLLPDLGGIPFDTCPTT